jgi:hypothetical protein
MFRCSQCLCIVAPLTETAIEREHVIIDSLSFEAPPPPVVSRKVLVVEENGELSGHAHPVR